MDRLDERKFHFNDPNARTTIPFELTRNGLFFQVLVNGSEPLWFSLDSGSGTNYIDLGVARKLGLEFSGTKKVYGAGKGLIEVQVAEGVSFELPGLLTKGHQVHGIDLTGVDWGRLRAGRNASAREVPATRSVWSGR